MADDKRLGRDPFSLKIRPEEEAEESETPGVQESGHPEEPESWSLRVDDLESHGVSKYDKLKPLEVRLALPQKHFLEQVADHIAAQRTKALQDKQRITKATVIRAWINALGQCIDDIQLEEVRNEVELTHRFKSFLATDEENSPSD